MHKASRSPCLLACSVWHHSPFTENIKKNPVKYGHKFDEGEDLVPEIVMELSIPVSFLFLVIILNVDNWQSAYAKRRQILYCCY